MKHTHYDLIINQYFTPTAKNLFGDVRHTGTFEKENHYGKIGQKFETWLTPDSYKVVALSIEEQFLESRQNITEFIDKRVDELRDSTELRIKLLYKKTENNILKVNRPTAYLLRKLLAGFWKLARQNNRKFNRLKYTE